MSKFIVKVFGCYGGQGQLWIIGGEWCSWCFVFFDGFGL